MVHISISNDIKNRMKNGMVWSFTGTALAKFLTLLAGIFCAHILSKELYGEFNMVRSTVNMFVVFGSAGLGVTATKYVSEYKDENKSFVPRICYITRLFGYFTGGIFTLLIILLAPFISSTILHSTGLSTALRIGAILLFFSVINGVQNGILSGFENFKAIALNNLAGSIFESVFMLIGAYYLGAEGAILGFGLGFIVIYVCNRLSIKKNFTLYNIPTYDKFKINREDVKILFSYSLPAALSSILIAPTFWAIRTMLVREDGFGELAVYEAADQWKVIILFIPTAISQIVLPLLSSLKSNNNSTFTNTLVLNIIVIGIISVVIAAIVFFASPLIMSFYGKGFDDNLPLKILAISTIFSAIANVLEMTAYSLGKMWQCFAINIVWAASMLLTAWMFLKSGARASGLSYAVLVSYIISCTAFSFYVWHVIKKGHKLAR